MRATTETSSCDDYARLAAAYSRLCASWGALTDGEPGSVAADLAAVSDQALLGFLGDVAALTRQLDTLKAKLASALDARAGRGAGIARATGHRDTNDLLATTLQVPVRDAKRLSQVGAMLERDGELGEGGGASSAPTPAAAAVEEGEIGVAYAQLLLAFRDRLTGRVPLDAIDRAERELIGLVREGMRLREFTAAITRLEANLDPARLTSTAAQQYAQREFTYRTDENGMLHVRGQFDPEHGAYLRTVIESYTTAALRNSRGHNIPGDAGVSPAAASGTSTSNVVFVPTGEQSAGESRTVKQMQADAIIACCQHLLGCDLSKVPGCSTTVVVRMQLNDLNGDGAEGSAGVVELDGGGVLDAGAARRRAAAAGIIPVVLGGASEVLDWGRERRHFTSAQRRALAERDGGCAICGLPPGMTEAHHLRWWHRDLGRTDLHNGVLLCTRCHHLVHDGWDLTVDGSTIWVVPPASVDPSRTPRIGGRKRYDLSHRAAHPPGPGDGALAAEATRGTAPRRRTHRRAAESRILPSRSG